MDPKRAPRLSLDLLRGFRAAAKHLSFTRAALELFVTQPAVSREVKTLEEQLGQPLFRRVKGTLELTAAGEALYRAADEAIGIIDAAAMRLTGSLRTLSVTTTVALASTWLVPRLPRFAQLHPEIDMRFLASNDALDLEREHLDVAIRFVLAGSPPPSQDKLFDYVQFPVCAPALARDPTKPLRTPADLEQHVLLDLETVVYGRPWYDWQQWFTAMKLREIKSSAWLRFSHYDQVIAAAVEGGGVAVGKRPHVTQRLIDGSLVAPLGAAGEVLNGSFYIEMARSAQPEVVAPFVDWLRAEAAQDEARLAETQGLSAPQHQPAKSRARRARPRA
jgi:DNA-binding transcriptional LysR family regulator